MGIGNHQCIATGYRAGCWNERKWNLIGLIHHSDCGVQYCCDPYVALLQKHGIAVSMTEDYKPTDNAVAERINGIIKAESSHPRGRFNDIGHARNGIARYIHFYNHRRLHMSIGYKIPAVAHLEKGIQKKMWKKNILPQVAIKRRMQYLCKAGQASTGSANPARWLSTKSGQLTLLCLLYQQGLGRSGYWTSTTFQEPSTDIGYKKKKRLAKSGKDKLILTGLVCVISHGILSPYHSFIPLRNCLKLELKKCYRA